MGHSTVIAKNTVFLYLRTLVIMFISIYTSRVMLQKLGVDNFGIYGVVGGVVSTFVSMRGVFSQTVQRFLNYEKGKGNTEKVNDVFNISVSIHIVLGIVFAIVVYAFGYFYIPRYLVLPAGMLDTAMFVFYCSVATSIVAIITIPYDAVIIANEKFNFYAIISIFDVLARLGVLYILWIGDNVLSTYAILICIVSVLFRLIHILYCGRFPECKFRIMWNKQIFKDLAGFSGWNFLGNTAFALTNEGINFVINIFGGVVANASRGIAYQVKSAVVQLSGNVGMASRPYVSEAVASKDKTVIFEYIIKVSKAMFLLVAITALPIIVYTRPILVLWLNDVPEYCVIFVQLVMMHIVIRAPQTGIDLLFTSYGKMKIYQIIQSSLLVLSLPISYILLKLGFPIYWAFLTMCIVEFITNIAIVICASKELGLSLSFYIKRFVVCTLRLTVFFSLLGLLFYNFLYTNHILHMILYVTLLVCVSSVIGYMSYLTKSEKSIVKVMIIDKAKKSI